jgi:hypothetical protein
MCLPPQGGGISSSTLPISGSLGAGHVDSGMAVHLLEALSASPAPTIPRWSGVRLCTGNNGIRKAMHHAVRATAGAVLAGGLAD